LKLVPADEGSAPQLKAAKAARDCGFRRKFSRDIVFRARSSKLAYFSSQAC
jgi:hypothetical protein